jgi:hypothetical protein
MTRFICNAGVFGDIFEWTVVDPVTIHDTPCALAWFNESTTGSRTGCDESEDVIDGDADNKVDGKARDDRYVDANKYFSLQRRCVLAVVSLSAGMVDRTM